MQSQLVFQEKKEMERLRVQNKLLSCSEGPVLAPIFSGREGLAVLDVGCNDGSKTVQWFSDQAVSQVIGLEYNEGLAVKAQAVHGEGRFSFWHLDVEAPEFAQRLAVIMKEKQIEAFDVIYLSFVLMHLSDVSRLLAVLRPFLKPDGKLIVIEANDRISTLDNDEQGLLGAYLEILEKEKYSGNRKIGAEICDRLAACGYEDIVVWHDYISAGVGETEKKKAVFTMFFTYMSEDIDLLLRLQPENEEYRSWSDWLACNYETLKDLILQEESTISMGIKILTCVKGKA